MCRNSGAPKAGNLEAWVLDLFGARPPYTILILERSLLVKRGVINGDQKALPGLTCICLADIC